MKILHKLLIGAFAFCTLQLSSISSFGQDCSRSPGNNSAVQARSGEVVCLTEGSYSNLHAQPGSTVKICGNVTILGGTHIDRNSTIIMLQNSKFKTNGSFARYGGSIRYQGEATCGAMIQLPYTSINYGSGLTNDSEIRVCGNFRIGGYGRATRSCRMPACATTACACPDVTLNQNTIALCPGNSFDLSALETSNTDEGSWSIQGNNDLTINNDVLIAGQSPGVYTVVFSADGGPFVGCDESAEVTVVINSNPIVDLGENQSFCEGSSTTLDAGNQGATYIWNTGQTTQEITVNQGGNYAVTVTNTSGCSATDDIDISINPSPTVNLGADQSFCEGGSTTLDAGNQGANYLWNTGETTQEITVTESGNYSVAVTNEFGCTGTDFIDINVNPNPVVSLGDDQQFCDGQSTILNAGNEGATYLWSTGETTQEITVNSAGEYAVTVTNEFGCASSDEIQIIINPNPVVDLGQDAGICPGNSITLDAGVDGDTYLWSTGETSQSITVSSAGIYSVIVTNEFGCATSDQITIILNPVPEVDLGTNDIICADSPYILDAGNEGATYFWNTGETTQQIEVTESGTYNVLVTNEFGCLGSDEISLEEFVLRNYNEFTGNGSCSPAAAAVDVYAGQTVHLTGGYFNELRVHVGGTLIVSGDVTICGSSSFNNGGLPGDIDGSTSIIYGDITFVGPVAIYGGELILKQGSSMNFNSQIARQGGVVSYEGSNSCGAQFNLNLPSGSVNSAGPLTASSNIYVNGYFVVWNGIGQASTGNAPGCTQLEVDPICPNLSLTTDAINLCQGASFDLNTLITEDTDLGLWSIQSAEAGNTLVLTEENVLTADLFEQLGTATLQYNIPCDFGLCETSTTVAVNITDCAVGSKFGKSVSSTEEGIKVYPSIANDQIFIEVAGTGSIQITSLTGSTIHYSEFASEKGNGQLSIPVADVTNGTYILNIQTKEGQHTSRVIIQH